LEISTKETNEIQQKNGRWYDKKRGRTAAKRSARRENPRDQAHKKMQWSKREDIKKQGKKVKKDGEGAS
jgi:hypothetical protein